MKFRKKPVVIEAIQYDGTPEGNRTIIDWTRGTPTKAFMDTIIRSTDADGEVPALKITTLEGDHVVSPGDWVIRGVAGEHYPCNPDIFAETYEHA